jgi:diguanylate cyclase (GGDEF)-like protein
VNRIKKNQLQHQELIDLYRTISLLNLDEISKVLVSRLPILLNIEYFTLFLYDKDKSKFNLICHNHPNIKDSLSIPLSSSAVMQDAVKSGSYILEEDFYNSKYYEGTNNLIFKKKSFLTIPLIVGNESMGVLNLNEIEDGSFIENNLNNILNMTDFISLSISNAVLYEQAKKVAVTDALTGIANRSNMEMALTNEFERSKRYNAPLSVIFLDIDNFKGVNDTYGHQKGDEVLVAVASLLQKFCRTNDVAARYGGEEFLMLLPHSNAQGAFKIAERVREEVMKITFFWNELPFSVTVSCGVTELNKDFMKNTEQLVAAGDQALYEAKNGGRNKTVIGPPVGEKK